MENLRRNNQFKDFNLNLEFLKIKDNKIEILKLLKIFTESNFNLGKVKIIKELYNNNPNILDHNILMFRYIFLEGNLYFLFSEFNGTMYIGKQSEKEMIDLNSQLNSSLEFNDIKSFLEFLQQNLFSLSKDLLITKNTEHIFYFESLIDIIKVKWEISTIKINERVIIFDYNSSKTYL